MWRKEKAYRSEGGRGLYRKIAGVRAKHTLVWIRDRGAVGSIAANHKSRVKAGRVKDVHVTGGCGDGYSILLGSVDLYDVSYSAPDLLAPMIGVMILIERRDGMSLAQAFRPETGHRRCLKKESILKIPNPQRFRGQYQTEGQFRKVG